MAKRTLVQKYKKARELMEESERRANEAAERYDFAEEDRQVERRNKLRDAARDYAAKGGVKTGERDAEITGGQWSAKAQGLNIS